MTDTKKTQDKLLSGYAKWRPRLRRGVTWAAPAAFLAKTMSGREGLQHVALPTAIAGAAGIADAALEEHLRKNVKAAPLVARAFDESKLQSNSTGGATMPNSTMRKVGAATDPDTAECLRGLMSHSAELKSNVSQLRSLFPETFSSSESVGRALRLSSGDTSVRRIPEGG